MTGNVTQLNPTPAYLATINVYRDGDGKLIAGLAAMPPHVVEQIGRTVPERFEALAAMMPALATSFLAQAASFQVPE